MKSTSGDWKAFEEITDSRPDVAEPNLNLPFAIWPVTTAFRYSGAWTENVGRREMRARLRAEMIPQL